jgi:hypothetical protein
LDDSVERTAPAPDLGRMDSPLQRRTTTFGPRSWAASRHGAMRGSDRPPSAVSAPRRGATETRRITPPLRVGTRGGVNSCGVQGGCKEITTIGDS